MKTNLSAAPSRAARFIPSAQHAALFIVALLWLCNLHTTHAGSATWDASPVSGDWNNAANWMPMTVPSSTSDTATFGSSSITTISPSAYTAVDGMVFNPGASAFTIVAADLPAGNGQISITETGIINNSGTAQNFVISAGNAFDGGFIDSGVRSSKRLMLKVKRATAGMTSRSLKL